MKDENKKVHIAIESKLNDAIESFIELLRDNDIKLYKYEVIDLAWKVFISQTISEANEKEKEKKENA